MESFLNSLRNSLPESVSPTQTTDEVVIIDEADPIQFWNRFSGAIENGRSLALLDPSWPDIWKHEYIKLAQSQDTPVSPFILIPTSGTTGKPKFCIHTIDTLRYAAKAFAKTFSNQGIIHSVNVLPQYHVGGLMPVLRSAECGGKSVFANYRQLPTASDLPFDLDCASLSLVPTQLSRLLQSETSTGILKKFGLILVGGAACPKLVLQQSREAGLRLGPCYGSTETAAMVTFLSPDEFLSGRSGVGNPLPGMEIQIDKNGLVTICSESAQFGYLPNVGAFQRNPFQTRDLGELDEEGNLLILGREDRVIISGGKKINPELVESAALESGLLQDACCNGVPDTDWGSRVELKVVFKQDTPLGKELLTSHLQKILPSFSLPKSIHSVSSISRNELGKLVDGS
jgi:O-succinylbenzoic acid--CoA ligase